MNIRSYMLASVAALLIAGTSIASAGSLETVACASATDANSIVASALAEPSLEADKGDKTAALIQSYIDSGACAKVELDGNAHNAAADKQHADGIAFGVKNIDGRHAVIMKFTGALGEIL